MEKIDYLINELIKEDSKLSNVNVPLDINGKKDLYRALRNIRNPKPISKEYLKIQDEYLQGEIKNKGIIDEKIFKELTSSFNKDKIKLTELNNNINNKLNYYKDKYSNFNNDLQKYKAFPKLNRFIIEEMIDKIYIGKINKTNKTRNIKIKWNF